MQRRRRWFRCTSATPAQRRGHTPDAPSRARHRCARWQSVLDPHGPPCCGSSLSSDLARREVPSSSHPGAAARAALIAGGRTQLDSRRSPLGTRLLRSYRRLGRALAMSSRLAARPTSYRRGSDGGVATKDKETTMPELLVDFITSLDGYASAESWPGWWGLEGSEYLAWLGEQPEVTYLMGANTYRLMSGFAAGETPAGTDEFTADEEASVDDLTRAPKVVFSASLPEPLTWANATLVRDDAVEAVRAMKEDGSGLLNTIRSLTLCRSLLRAGLVDRFRVVMFPVITGATGAERIYDGYPDVALEMIDNRTFDGRIQLVEYRPRVLEHPPLDPNA